MNIFILLAISMAAAQLGGITKKLFTNKFGSFMPSHNICTSLTMLAGAVALCVWNGEVAISSFSFYLGTAFGLVTALSTVFTLKAMAIGPWSYSTVIISMSTFIPALSGLLFWGESIAPLQIVGMACMVGCILFSTEFKKGEQKKSFVWLMYCAIAFVSVGLIGVMQKIHQTSAFKNELGGFLVVAFIVGAVFSAVLAIFEMRKHSDTVALGKIFTPIPLLWIVVCGACAAANHKLNLFLSGELDTVVFFPTVNGGGLVLTTICALLFFKEKLTKKQWVGMAFGVASVLLLCNYS